MSRESDAKKINEVASRIGTNPAWLDALINFETAGTYNPLIAGSAATGAHGLIQVIDSTAQSIFGYQDSLSLVKEYPTFDAQMDGVVYPYLKKQMPYSTQQSLYMAVFYPKYRFVNPSTRFPDHVIEANKDPKTGIAHIQTVQDYINFVNSRIKQSELRLPPAAPLLIIALAVGAWLIYKRF